MIGLAAALTFALSSSSHRAAPKQEVAVVHHRSADVLARAPKDYSAAAQARVDTVGPTPLPQAEPAQTGVAPDASSAPPVSGQPGSEIAAELQRRRQQRDSAHSSKLFAASGEGERALIREEAAGATPAPAPTPEDGASPTANADAQDRKAAFVRASTAVPTVNSGRLAASPGRYVVTAGSTIAAALITGLSSDLPGEVVAQVTEDVFDSVTGRAKLIPQGSRLIGSYDAHVIYGQSRALVIWTRLILSDGRSLDLDRLVGTDAGGQSGFADRANHHTGKLLEAGLLSTLFGVGSGVASGGGSNNDIAFAIRDSAGQSVERAGDKLVEHQLDVQPTITIRPGARVRVLVSRDLVLEPWGG